MLERHRTGGQRKPPWHLVPWSALAAIVRVLAKGAVKHGDRHWEGGMLYSEHFSAALRHITAWWERDDNDPETGESHLAHAASRILFLLAYMLEERADLDDRPERAAIGELPDLILRNSDHAKRNGEIEP
jgi:hypothetical protein